MTDIAAEAASAQSVASLMCELHALRAALQALQAAAPASNQSEALAPPAQASPEPDSAVAYVRALRSGGPVHVKCSVQQGRAKCRWKWAACGHLEHLVQPIHFRTPGDNYVTPLWVLCREALSDSGTSSSSGEEDGEASASPCG